jgi:hypothetical protein
MSQNKNGTRKDNYAFIKNEIAMLHLTTFILFSYTKYEIPEAQKYQVRQTNVNNNYITVHKNFIECIII